MLPRKAKFALRLETFVRRKENSKTFWGNKL